MSHHHVDPTPAAGHDPFEDLIVHERPRRQRARIALNLTAMIDVVFLLLIYFMVATEFKAGEEIFRLDLPERQAASRDRGTNRVIRMSSPMQITSPDFR